LAGALCAEEAAMGAFGWVAVALCATMRVAQAADLAPEGRRLAQDLCAGCHASAAGKGAISPGAPDFETVARNPAMTALAIRVFLQTPHANMPDIMLSDDDIAALTAYILSLRK